MSLDKITDGIDTVRFIMSVCKAEKDVNEKFDKIIKIVDGARNRLLDELKSKESDYEFCSEFKQLETLGRNRVQIEDMFRDNSQQDLLEDNVCRIDQRIQVLKEKLNTREVIVNWQLDKFYIALKYIAHFSTNEDISPISSPPTPPTLPPRKQTPRSRSITVPEISSTAPKIPARAQNPPPPRVIKMPTTEEKDPPRLVPKLVRVDPQPEDHYMEMSSSSIDTNNPFGNDLLIQSAPQTEVKPKCNTLGAERNIFDPLPSLEEIALPLPPVNSHSHRHMPRKMHSAPAPNKRRSSSIDNKILGVYIERISPKFAGCSRGKDNEDLYKANTVEIDIGSSNIYIADTYNHCVKVFDSKGKFKSLFGRKSPGKLSYPFGMCISGKVVYVGEKMDGKIKAFQLDGTFMKEITGDGTKRGQFKFLWGISADSDNGDIYACDNENDRIQVYTNNLEFRHTIIGPALPGNVTGPVDVKIRNLMIIVLDQEDPCVHYFDKQGVKLWSMVKFSDANASMAPQCFTFDIEDNIIITDATTHTIRIFTPKGELYIALGKKGEKAGEFYNPTGIALDNEGNIVSICQREKSNLQIITYST